MTWTELGEHAASATYVDKVAHITERSKFAALERQWSYVCPVCVGELLVRSGEQPRTPTSKEQAFDTSVVAKGVRASRPVIRCKIHGLQFGTRSSPQIISAIRSGGVLPEDARLIRVLVTFTKHENEFWFDEAFLRQVLGSEIEITASPYRLEDRKHIDPLLDAAAGVCPHCMRDFLTESGVEL
ncbi:hypothetical protein N0A02_13880 [Paraburkholderia acidicola]|uniref:Uncharacterized protein n=1 Tax=Paraburkholderia acidicola TaxID=1912599 RepID=A0ABV1LMN5_9BURK